VDAGAHGYGYVALSRAAIAALMLGLVAGCIWLDGRLPSCMRVRQS
jgi:hypothetical protein